LLSLVKVANRSKKTTIHQVGYTYRGEYVEGENQKKSHLSEEKVPKGVHHVNPTKFE